MNNKITPLDLKRINKNRIYRLIRYSNGISRHEIANTLKLSLPTVNQNLKTLEADKLIIFNGNFESTGGRKAQTININGLAGLAVNVNINPDNMVISIINLAGEIIAGKEYDVLFNQDIINRKAIYKQEPKILDMCKIQHSNSDIIYGQIIAENIDKVIKDNKIHKKSILGVGITVAGVFDKSGEYILSAPILNVKNYAVNNIKKYIDYPCIIINDAKSSAYEEIWNTDDEINQYNKDYIRVYLSVNKGVGGAIIIDNKNYIGMHNRAGEFGHMTIIPEGNICECGKYGCLEAYISTSNLSEKLNITLQDFFMQVKAGNSKYKALLKEYINKLCIGINNIYMIFDSPVILGGEIAPYLREYEEEIRSVLVEINSFDTAGNYFQISNHNNGDKSIGAALIFLDEFIEAI